MHVRNPVEWGVEQLKIAGHTIEAVAGHRSQAHESTAPPTVCQIGVTDLAEAIAQGIEDFGAFRTDVVFLCVIYPVIGLVLARLAFGYHMLPLLFPLASGFALVGPFAAVGLYEMSRRREQGVELGWGGAFGVLQSPAFGAIIVLGLLLMVIFLLWLGAAMAIYDVTLGPEPPTSIGGFLHDVLMTSAGWALIVIGIGVGFVFAVVAMAVSVVSFPILLDRDVPLHTAISTSVRAVAANPSVMALWGFVVALGLVLGSIPLFIGLIIVMPVAGHATWHLYRKLVATP
jgi:uncharacterized membrane protein